MNYDLTSTDDQVTAAVESYLATRDRLDAAGDPDWGELASHFTEDAVWVDCAWGRVEGRDEIASMLRHAMVGIDFSNPVDFWAVTGSKVLIKWRQILPGQRADGRPWQQSAVSTLLYAGDGLFRYEEDLLNVIHCTADIVESGWQPGEGFNIPPEEPDLDFDPLPRSQGRKS
ncbi:hypothetical protein BH10ACT3_BH10ACT3_12890 [soil metagenome]